MARYSTATVLLGVVLSLIGCLREAAGQAKADEMKKIVFLAGPKDHGGPGAHEYAKDLMLLKRCLDTSPNVPGVATEIHVGKPPQDFAELRDAAAIVIHSSGDTRADEAHALFPTNNPQNVAATYSAADAQRLEQMDRLMKRGTGIVVLHYSLIVDNPRSREYLLDWIGGYHHSGESRVKIDRSEATPATPGHEILRGVRPWTTDHEYYFNQHFRTNDRRAVPIITSRLPSDDPQPHVIAWAVRREGGGRGFAFTGGHYHKNMWVDDYRRMLLNAIVWTARIPVPKQGVVSTMPPQK
jgi:type 1 glutamine amidotransferase